MAGGAGGAESGAMTVMGMGAMIGSVVPGVGTAIGAVVGAVGGAIAGAFFGGHPAPTYITDLNIPTSQYGKGVPQVFGTARVSGNIIWTGTAQAQMESVGGKGSK
jgi:hypothetical protein